MVQRFFRQKIKTACADCFESSLYAHANLSLMLDTSSLIFIYLFVGDNYALKMRFVDHIFDNLVIDQMTFKIILPEGAA